MIYLLVHICTGSTGEALNPEYILGPYDVPAVADAAEKEIYDRLEETMDYSIFREVFINKLTMPEASYDIDKIVEDYDWE